jgi:hypothetical protein
MEFKARVGWACGHRVAVRAGEEVDHFLSEIHD